jgi:hypothetical protein
LTPFTPHYLTIAKLSERGVEVSPAEFTATIRTV